MPSTPLPFSREIDYDVCSNSGPAANSNLIRTMIIKKLELHGFKSFAEKIRLKFHPGITCIIGPNGTGKSNIVDGLLWVLGGRSMKALRGEQRGDIIFNGNTKKAPMSMADVTIYFEEGDEELQLRHRIFRSGESEYRMDGKAVRLKDIQDELWKRSVGESQYFVIEQGTVGLFITSKPQEKRALLEEAAGTAFYKDKKRKAQNKLVSSEQNLIRLEDIITEVAKAKNSLKRQANAAVRYRKLREQIRMLTSYSFRKKIADLENVQREIYEKYNQSQLREKTTLQNLKEAEKDLSQKRKAVWDQEEAVKAVKDSLYSLRAKLSRMESEKEREEKRIDYFDEKKSGSETNRKELDSELEGLDKEETDIKSEMKILIDDLQNRQNALSTAKKNNSRAEEEISKRRKDIEKLRRDQLENLASLTEAKNEAAKVEKELEMILRQEEKIQVLQREAKDNLAEKKAMLESLHAKSTATEKDLNKQRQNLEKERKGMAGLQEAVQILGHRLDVERRERDRAAHHLDVLEKLSEKERSADTAKISGVKGILADFIDSDAKHAPLIDVFWKEEAKAFLVNPSEFLKEIETNKPKGTFLLLHPDKKGTELPSGYKDPAVLGLLKARVRPDAKIKKHISHLREAGIVKDIGTAVNLWLRFPSLNLITMEGDLLLASGLLTLGKKKEGLFAINQEIKDLKESIASIDKRIQPLSDEMDLKAQEKASLKIRIQTADGKLSERETALAELQRDLQIEQADADKTQANFDIIQKEIIVFRNDRDRISKRSETGSSQIRALAGSENSLKDTLSEEEKTLGDIQQKTSDARDHYFEVKSQIDLAEEKISNFNRRLLRIKERREFIASKMESLTRDAASAEEEKSKTEQILHRLGENTSLLSRDIKEKETTLHKDESAFKDCQRLQEEKEKLLETIRAESESIKEDRVKWEIKKAEKDRDLVNLEESCWQELKKTIDEVKEEIPVSELEDIEVLEDLAAANEDLQKYSSVNLMAEEEYDIQNSRYEFLVQQQEDLKSSIHSTREAIKRIDQESKSQFLTALEAVNKNFQDVFSMLFEGGKAEIYLNDPDNPLDSGVEVKAQPPGKRVQSLSLLSGGEKTLSSLAFFFALFRFKPTPFCLLDEVDAALDEANLTRFLRLMDKIRQQTQFIIITHNFKTMEVADYIYGTTMGEPNITSVYSVKMDPKTKQLQHTD